MSDHTQAPKLAPCPFCGGMAVPNHFGGRAESAYAVWCDSCHISTAWMHGEDGHARAIEAWNRRSTPQGEEPAKGAAQDGEVPPLPEPFMDLHTPTVREAWERQMREYGAACRAGERADARDAARYRWLMRQVPSNIADIFEDCVIGEVGETIDDEIEAEQGRAARSHTGKEWE